MTKIADPFESIKNLNEENPPIHLIIMTSNANKNPIANKR